MITIFLRSLKIIKNLLVHFAVISLILEQFLFVSISTANAAENLPLTPDGTTNTQIDSAANGVPIVNIAAPNSGGLSHNKFNSYNVNPSGLVINNATGNPNQVVQTQIGGLITDNPNLANSGSARVILNEVTSTNRSILNGYTEIGGRQADLIIANPNGIEMNSAGFINIGRLTAVVGSANQFNPNPSNLSFNLNGNKNSGNGFLPKLTISGLGLDVTRVAETDLVANIMEIVSPIYGGDNRINFRAGDKELNYSTKEVTSDNTNPGTNQPDEVAIDASNVAKVQAGQIYMIATKEGFGVKYTGDMLASRSGVTIDAKGDVVYNNIASESGGVNVKTTNGNITATGITHNKDVNNDVKLEASNNVNNQGQIVSARDVDVTAGSTFNNTGTEINLSDRNFTINANQVNNLGNLSAVNNLSLTADILNNSKEIIANNDITITGSRITNDDSIIAGNKLNITATNFLTNNNDILSLVSNLAETALTINAKTLNNNKRIAANSILTINANSLNNNTANSLIISGNDTNLNITNLDNNLGTIESKNNLKIRNLTTNNSDAALLLSVSDTSTNISNSGTLKATNSIDINLGSSDYEIIGKLETDGFINIEANNITNKADIGAINYIKLTSTGYFTNGINGGDNSNIKIASNTSLDITANNNINNYGTLSAKTILSLKSLNGNINNYNGAELLASNQNSPGTSQLILEAINGAINQYSPNSVVVNGDHTITATDYTNTGRIDISGSLTMNIANNLINDIGALIYAGNNMFLNVVNNLTNKTSATIYAENNLTIRKYDPTDPSYNAANNKINQLENISGSIETYTGDILIDAVTVTNKREYLPTQGGESEYRRSSWYAQHGWHTNVYYRSAMTGAVAPIATINASNDLTINTTTLTNNSSSIYAGRDLTINATTINNVSNLYRDYVAVRHWDHNWGGQYGSHSDGGSGGYWYTGTKDGYVNQAYTYSANIKAGRNLLGTITSQIDNSTIAANVPDILSVTDRNGQIVNGIDLDNVVISGVVSKDLSSYINGPDNQGMFQKNTNPNGPLFETRSQFVDQSKFFGSDYFYTKIGLNLTDVQTEFEQQNKRLVGDQFFQAKIIEEQLKTIRKNALLLSDSGTNVNTEIQSLLDNAADEYTRLGLTANETLTQTQIDSLEKDIVWFETETINGELYVVPKIYLTKATRDSLNNNDSLTTKSTIMAMGDLQLNSDSLTNSGSIVGNNVTVTTTNDITNNNFSDVIATNGLNLTSNSGSIINFSKLKGGGAVSLTAANNITNTSTVKTNAANLLDSDNPAYISNGSTASNSGNISSTLFETAAIEAASFTASAGNDFSNYGANITTTSGDLNITAGDDIRIETVELRNRSEYRSKKYTKITDTTTNVSSNITSAGGITLTTNGSGTDNESGTSDLGVGSSILVSGSNVSAVNDLNLSANNNAIITNAVNKDYSFEQRTKKGSIKTSRTSSTDYVETAVNSNLTGKNVNITTNNNIYVQGSDLNSNFDTATNTGGNTNLTAVNDTIITNAILQEYHHTTKEVSNRGVFKGVTAITSAVIDLATVGINAAIAVASPVLKNIDDPLQKVVRNIPLLPSSLADNIADQIDYDKARNKYKDTVYENQYHNTKIKTSTKNDLVNIVASNVNAGNNLTITSTNNTTLQASNLNSGTADTAGTNSNVTGSTTINTNNLNILAGTSYNINTVDKRTGKTMAIRNNTTGNMVTDYTNSNLTAKNDGFTFNVTNQADIRAKDLTDPSISQPSYLTALKAQVASDKISETNLAIANKHWEDTTRQLTETGTAVIAVGIVVAVVAVTILTAGAGAAPATAAAGTATAGGTAAAGAGAGAAAAGTAATAGGAAVATGATVATGAGVAAGAATSGITMAGIATVAATAAGTTALTTATISATQAGMNADGDFFKQAKGISKTTWDDTTSKDAFESYAIAAGTAVLTAGLTQGLDSATGGVATAGNSANATLSQKITTALAESAVSTVSSTAVQSSVNGDSFSEALENQGQNVLIGAIGNLGAKQIGVSYKTGKIEKPTQLALHAGLGCAMGAAGGGDCASGAMSGVTGELAGMALQTSVYGSNPTLTKDQAAQLAGAAGGLSAIFTGNAVGLSDGEVADNIFSGQRIGDNAARNNALFLLPILAASATATGGLVALGDGDAFEGAKKINEKVGEVVAPVTNAIVDGVDTVANKVGLVEDGATPVRDGLVKVGEYYDQYVPEGTKGVINVFGLTTMFGGGVAAGKSLVSGSKGLVKSGVGNNSPGTDLVPYYPPNDGFLGNPKTVTLMPGTKIDRYGRDGGTYTSPVGTPDEMRSLIPGTNKNLYNIYEVTKPIEVQSGIISPAFGQHGLGTQHIMPKPVIDLLNEGYLKKK
jgi:hypothetical protein